MFSASSRFVAIALALAATWISSSLTVTADELLEEGPNYFVVQHDAGGDIGSVTMRMDISVDAATGYSHVTSRIVNISAHAGWTWEVRKAGGVDKAVEVLFKQGKQRLTFKALYVPGKTVIDGGIVK